MTEEPVSQEGEGSKIQRPVETLSRLLRDLDRHYRRLWRELKRRRSREKEPADPRWLERLEEINAKMEDLESEMERP